ncbi:hypothetical protein C8D92_102302 [Tamilnaduibacter salinus]|uniref:Uncharacterized protein n=1 Tax=Tamilnaduibacter salinus TaxID=1484056 RepID=A0A2U1CZQ3_9GAMM|nr:hypothetical protein [Tamilnaduibacter salinus]PVY78262.1 hypothetical protein C8D92_102302 [Tamilnaduibacter salinus]
MTYRQFIKSLVCVLVLSATAGSVFAQSGTESGDQKGKQEYVQKHFERMYKKAVERASEKLENGTPVKAFAVVVSRKDEVRVVEIEQLKKMPADVALEVLKRSLRALVAKKGSFGAVCMVYSSRNPNKDAKAEYVLVAQMEHVFGPTLAQITPYTMKSGDAKFGEPVVTSMEPMIFKVERKGSESGE